MSETITEGILANDSIEIPGNDCGYDEEGTITADNDFEDEDQLQKHGEIKLSDIPNTMQDRYGVYQVHATKHGGEEVFCKDGFSEKTKKIEDFLHERKVRNYEHKTPKHDPTDEWNANMNDNNPNLEATGYFKITDPRHDDAISIKLRGPEHKEKKHFGSWYIIGIEFDGKKHFEKEYDHDDGNKKVTSVDGQSTDVGSIVDKWVGIKAITVNEGNGVRCTCYVDKGGLDSSGKPANQWTKIFDVLDNNNPIKKCNQLKGDGHIQIQFRIDACGKINGKNVTNSPIKAKYISCRQV
jgi:hypothetical protein